jgi:hypothetical protein
MNIRHNQYGLLLILNLHFKSCPFISLLSTKRWDIFALHRQKLHVKLMGDTLESLFSLIQIVDLDGTLKVPKSSIITFEIWSRIYKVIGH